MLTMMLQEQFEQHRDTEQAVPMSKYMKNLFPFLGIKTPLRNELTRQFYSETEILMKPFLPELVLELWEKSEREYQYAALDYISKKLNVLSKEHFPLLEQLITEKSWWDTVDALAAKPVGKLAIHYPELIAEHLDEWSTSDHLWRKRTSILFQLKYKHQTNEELLYRYILQNANSREFFIQKAIGWALREYSKTAPDSVRQFISTHTLAMLSIREGSKYL
ncbi:DNA-7-methylguanine glycosylase [Bacillus sp. OV322]|uniref:DNA alkylation repair protein n=1 Tax=Bacillus sp. OV322 TaxID=1882764 RepID=UPI0008E8873D|nr:DNA alkylation repair protein [Bacillus sp. OV322]SFC30384.1 DNA-7-methylguanine glycosylase [Bacillus sp. OV322]